MLETLKVILIIVLLLAWFATAIAGLNQRNKFYSALDKIHSQKNKIAYLTHELEKAQARAALDKNRIETLEKSVVEYKKNINKISNYFKEKK